MIIAQDDHVDDQEADHGGNNDDHFLIIFIPKINSKSSPEAKAAAEKAQASKDIVFLFNMNSLPVLHIGIAH